MDKNNVISSLHKAEVTPTRNVFLKDGKCEYVLVRQNYASGYVKQAIGYLAKVIYWNYNIPMDCIEEEKAEGDNRKKIVFNCPDIFKKDKVVFPKDDVGPNGHYVVTKNGNVYIKTNLDPSLFYAVNNFLNKVIGYEFFSEDTVYVKYKKNETVYMPDVFLVERPDFIYYRPNNRNSAERNYGYGYQAGYGYYAPLNGNMWHNTFNAVPPAIYKKDHPKWYSDPDWLNQDSGQLCYTAHGDKKEYKLLVDTAFEAIKESLDKFPLCMSITFTIQDNHAICQCPACKALKKKYGTDSAAVILFCNDLGRKMKKYYGNKRKVQIVFFAYHKTEKAPYKNISEMKLLDNVGVYIAPIRALYNHPFEHEKNKETYKLIEGWAKLTKNIDFWLYETNFSHYLLPYNSFYSMPELLRYCKSKSSGQMYSEGQHNQENVTAFGRLKDYYDALAYKDVTVDFDQVKDHFFDHYFEGAKKQINAYFKELVEHMYYIENTFPEVDQFYNIYSPMCDKKLWSKELLTKWMKYLDDGCKAVEKYKDTKPMVYYRTTKHIKLESIFPRYLLIQLYGDTFDKDVLTQMKISFRQDCDYFGITQLSEVTPITNLYAEWGIY